MTDEELIQVMKEKSHDFSDSQLLDVATIADESYKRNYCQLYEPEDFAEEFVEKFVETIKNLPPEVAEPLKEKILNL